MQRLAKKIREDKGLSLTDVTREVSVTLGHLSRFERGEANLGLEKLQELAHFYGVTIDDLVKEVEADDAAAVAR